MNPNHTPGMPAEILKEKANLGMIFNEESNSHAEHMVLVDTVFTYEHDRENWGKLVSSVYTSSCYLN